MRSSYDSLQDAGISALGSFQDVASNAYPNGAVNFLHSVHVEWPDCGAVDHGSGDVWVQQAPDIHPKSTGHFGELRLYHRAIPWMRAMSFNCR
jgi:hypothetical protein